MTEDPMNEDPMAEHRMTEHPMTLPPIHREVVVAATAAEAFEVFTDEIGGWWPLGEFGVFGRAATVAFEAGRLVERSPEGETDCWGEVTTWAPPHTVAFTWHPGNPSRVTEVTVTFEPMGDQTLVTLEHQGWEAFADPDAARTGYGEGWPVVLGCYAGRIHPADETESGADDTDAATWVVLEHRPGPGTPTDGTLFEQPLFGEHVAFLQRMQSSGYLVAAGPLEGGPGEGMTILRLPGADRLEDATRLATEDDVSVTDGLFTVTVRAWQVMFAAAG